MQNTCKAEITMSLIGQQEEKSACFEINYCYKIKLPYFVITCKENILTNTNDIISSTIIMRSYQGHAKKCHAREKVAWPHLTVVPPSRFYDKAAAC